jgi:uncharacterized RDD family membrane protein YckC
VFSFPFLGAMRMLLSEMAAKGAIRMVYGGFWVRFVAYLIDAIIIGIGSTIIRLVVSLLLGTGMGMLTGGGSFAVLVIGLVISTVGGWLYYALMESSQRQATFGKQAFGLIVTDLNGDRIGFGQATGRYFAKILSGLILYIGFIMVGFTDRKQGLHDMIAGTLVAKADPGVVPFGETFA